MKQNIDQPTYSLLLTRGLQAKLAQQDCRYPVMVEFHKDGSPLHYVVMNKGE